MVFLFNNLLRITSNSKFILFYHSFSEWLLCNIAKKSSIVVSGVSERTFDFSEGKAPQADEVFLKLLVDSCRG